MGSTLFTAGLVAAFIALKVTAAGIRRNARRRRAEAVLVALERQGLLD